MNVSGAGSLAEGNKIKLPSSGKAEKKNATQKRLCHCTTNEKKSSNTIQSFVLFCLFFIVVDEFESLQNNGSIRSHNDNNNLHK